MGVVVRTVMADFELGFGHVGNATPLVLHALERALTMHRPAPDLLIHADRGSQYTSAARRSRIDGAEAVPSFGLVTPSTTHRPKPHGIRSQPSRCPQVPLLPPLKKLAPRLLTTATLTLR